MSRSRSLTIGAVISLAILLIAAVSFIWVPYDVTQLSIPDKLQRPNWTHWLGTDHFGRDLFSMIMVGGWDFILKQHFLFDLGAAFEQFALALELAADRLLDKTKAVNVLDFGACAQGIAAHWP